MTRASDPNKSKRMELRRDPLPLDNGYRYGLGLPEKAIDAILEGVHTEKPDAWLKVVRRIRP